YDMDKGYVCAFSAVVIKSATAYIFHVGDTRVYRLRGGVLEQLTEDHRLWVSREKNYLSRALGMKDQVEIDYQALPAETGDIFLLATDGVYEHADSEFNVGALDPGAGGLEASAKLIAAEALARGSADNLTIQIVKIDQLPDERAGELYHKLGELPFAPDLAPRT